MNKEYQQFKKELKDMPDKLGICEDELYNLYLFCKYSNGIQSKEEGKRISNILSK